MMKTSFQSCIDNNNDNLEKIDSNERVFTVFFLKISGYKLTFPSAVELNLREIRVQKNGGKWW